MWKKLFKARQKLSVKAPVGGETVPLADVPDPAFAEKMLGDGLAILPSSGKLVAPIDGEVVQIFSTKHALGLRSNEGIELLIHIGIDTVLLKGEGFHVHVQEGEQVLTGQALLDFSLELVQEKAKSPLIPIVITNGELVESLDISDVKPVVSGETVIMSIRSK